MNSGRAVRDSWVVPSEVNTWTHRCLRVLGTTRTRISRRATLTVRGGYRRRANPAWKRVPRAEGFSTIGPTLLPDGNRVPAPAVAQQSVGRRGRRQEPRGWLSLVCAVSCDETVMTVRVDILVSTRPNGMGSPIHRAGGMTIVSVRSLPMNTRMSFTDRASDLQRPPRPFPSPRLAAVPVTFDRSFPRRYPLLFTGQCPR